MSTREFPRFGGGEELTSQQVNALIDQMRRQCRLYATPPLEAVQTPEGWMVRLRTPPGFWAFVREGGAGSDGTARYAYEEASLESTGEWIIASDGKRGKADDTGATESNSQWDVDEGTLVWMTPREEGLSTSFLAPPRNLTSAPKFFWGEITGETDAGYYFVVTRYSGGGFTPVSQTDSDTSSLGSLAVESNGKTGIAVGTIALMRLAPGEGQVPVFTASSSATGFWAMYRGGNAPAGMPYFGIATRTVTLNGGVDSVFGESATPTGGTWRFSVTTFAGSVIESCVTDLAFDATVSDLRTAIESFTTFPYGDLQVLGTDGGPWTFLFTGTLAGLATVRVVTDNLEYEGETPDPHNYSNATGPWAAMVGISNEGGAVASGGSSLWVECERSAGGLWYVARGTPRTVSVVNVYATNTGSAVNYGDVVFLELATTLSGVGSVNYTIDATGLSDGTGAVYPDGAGLVISIESTDGTFVLKYNGSGSYATAPIAFDATADQVAAAVNDMLIAKGFTDGDSAVVASGGPLPGTVRLDWADPTVGAGGLDREFYVYERENTPTKSAGYNIGVTRFGMSGYSFNDIQEIRLYSPGEGGFPTGGTLTLKYGDLETAALPFDAVYQDVQDALENLDGLAGNVTCSGGPFPGPIRVEFMGDLAGEEAELLEVGTNSLTTAEEDLEASPEVFRPRSRIIRTNGQISPTVASDFLTFSMTCGGQTIPLGNLEPSVTDSFLLIALARQYLATALPSRLVTGQGGFAGPWRLVFAGRFAKTLPPAFSFAVQSPGLFTVTSADTDSVGVTVTKPDAGSVKFALGAQWQVSMTGAAGSSMQLLVNGTPTSVAYGASAASVAAAVASLSGTSIYGGGGPLGTHPVYLEVQGYLPYRTPFTLAVGSTSYSAPSHGAPTVTCSYLEEVPDDAVYYQLKSNNSPTSGQWSLFYFSSLQHSATGYSPHAVLRPVPVFPWNATAAAVQSVIQNFTCEAGGYGYPPVISLTPNLPWLGYRFFPFVNITCSGGPLPIPITIKIPVGLSEPWRTFNYPTLLGPYDGFDYAPVLAPQGRLWPDLFLTSSGAIDSSGLTSSSPSVTTTGTVTWLGTNDLPVATLTPSLLQSALRGTTMAGLHAVVSDDGDGLWTISLPDYNGPVDFGNWGARPSMFGWASGGKLLFYYNTAPRAGFPTWTENSAIGDVPELNTQWASASGKVLQPTERLDGTLGEAAPAAFRARIIRDASVSPYTGATTSGVYPWVELTPGPRRTPRTSMDGYMIYEGPTSPRNSSLFNVASTVRTAIEVSGNPSVPDAAEVWLSPDRGYDGLGSSGNYFQFGATPPVPKVARITPSGILLDAIDNAVNADLTQYSPLTSTLVDAQSFSNPTTAIAAKLHLPHVGRFIGVYPDKLTPSSAGTSPIKWSTPRSEPISYVGNNQMAPETGPGILRYAAQFYENGLTGQLDTTGTDSNSLTQIAPPQFLGNGDKAVDGSVFVWEKGGVGIRPVYQDAQYGLPFFSWNPNRTFVRRGRSVAVSIAWAGSTHFYTPPATPPTAGCYVTFGSWGTIGPIHPQSTGLYIQELVDTLFGKDVCVVNADPAFTRFTFQFFWGPLAGQNPGTVTLSNDTFEFYNYGYVPLSGSDLPLPDNRSGVAANDFATTTTGYFHLENGGTLLDGGGGGIATGSSVNETSLTSGVDPSLVYYLETRTSSLVTSAGVAQMKMVTGVSNFTSPADLTPGTSLRVNCQLECGAGVGDNYTNARTVDDTFVFAGGVCMIANHATPVRYTGTFLTNDGRTATCLNGYIMSVV